MPSARWGALAESIAEPWAHIQNDDGTFPDYVFGGEPGFRARYGESILGYGLLLTGLRTGDGDLLRAGLRGVSYAVGREDLQRERPSVFENLAVAAAYNLCRRRLADDDAFRSRRADWQHWLRSVRLIRVDSLERFVNKQVVESAGTLEMLRTGLHSSVAQAVLGGQRRGARATVLEFVNKRVPRIADRDGVEVAGEHTLVLSDPASNPPAYHSLCLGFYARAVDLLGSRATAPARRALRSVVRASLHLAGPDGDVSYAGRSQEQAWTLACTAYGAEVAAALPGVGEREQRRARALSERALLRLAEAYEVGPAGLWITPALAKDHDAGLRGLDGYAGASVYNGLTLVLLEWAIQRMGGRPRETAQIPADEDHAVRLSRREGELAIVRQGGRWWAVKRAISRADFPSDLRYDFGLHALKAEAAGGGWRDLAPIRPRTDGARADSAGPILRVGNRRGLPYGRRMRVDDDGVVRVGGGFMTDRGDWLRSGVTFRWAPDDGGVRLTWRAREGDRYEYSALFRDTPGGPTATADAVADGDLRVRCSEPVSIDAERGYASGADPKLVRVRMEFRAAADGAVTLWVGPA